MPESAASVDWISSPELIDYHQSLQFMNKRVGAIEQHTEPECIWFLEHPPLYTMGTSANVTDIKSTLPYPLIHSGRGGKITYHGPGQLIGYVMLDLNNRGRDLKQFVRNMAAWISHTLKEFGIEAYYEPDRIGLWIKKNDLIESKIAAFGIRVQRWITCHGFSLNINPDLSHYNFINPCGLNQFAVTSLHHEGIRVTRAAIEQQLKQNFVTFF